MCSTTKRQIYTDQILLIWKQTFIYTALCHNFSTSATKRALYSLSACVYYVITKTSAVSKVLGTLVVLKERINWLQEDKTLPKPFCNLLRGFCNQRQKFRLNPHFRDLRIKRVGHDM